MTDLDFDAAVIRKSHVLPVMVDFWAPWCSPCRALTPILEQVAARNAERVTLVKINTEEHPELADRFRIRSIPNVKLFIDGQAVDEFSGALPAELIQQWLDRALPSAQKESLQQAIRLMDEGRGDEALALIERVHAAEPDNHQASVLLAELQLSTDHRQASETVAGIGPDSDWYATAEAIRTFARLFDLTDHPESLPEHPVKPAYLAAAEQLADGNHDAALQSFIDVVRKARNYDDDGARKACVAIFRLLGDEHPLTRTYRGQLSSALYV